MSLGVRTNRVVCILINEVKASKENTMAAAYHRFMNGAHLAISKTGLTNPEIKKNMPHGPGNDASGAVNKTPGKVSTVTGK